MCRLGLILSLFYSLSLSAGFESFQEELKKSAFLAVKHRHLDVAKGRIEFGVPINSVDDEGNNFLHIAAVQNHNPLPKVNMDSYLIKAYPSETILKHFIQQGVPLFQKNKQGLTALELIIQNKHEGVFQYLLGSGKPKGSTILHEAIKHRLKNLVADLITKHPSLIYALDKERNNSLHIAVKAPYDQENLQSIYDYQDIIKLLIVKDVSLFEQNSEEITPIQIILENKDRETLQFLRINAPLVAKRLEGTTILHEAIRYGLKDVVKDLVKIHGFSIHEINAQGKTCSDIALENSYDMLAFVSKL